MKKQVQFNATFTKAQIGKRLDQALTKVLSSYSRSIIKNWILNGQVSINGKVVNKPRKKISSDEIVTIKIEAEDNTYIEAQHIPLDILYEDEYIIIVNKPRNLVVHPGAGNPDRTMLNALLHYYPKITDVPRAGIVHRLDKDTTGLMVIAKTISAQTNLIRSFQLRKVVREYEAIVIGNITSSGVVNQPISRHITNRTRMAVNSMGKPAITHYRVVECFRFHTHLCLHLETGRTHQIRVHMEHINHNLVGDPVYRCRNYSMKGISESVIATLQTFNRQALHATKLRIFHPITGVEMQWYAPLPQDMVNLIKTLKQNL